MYLINLDLQLKVVGVSSNFKKLTSAPTHSLKNCFFLSMVDCDVPDQLAEDMQDSLSKGLVYNSVIKLNQALSVPQWFDVTISSRHENGNLVGYLVRLDDKKDSSLKTTFDIYLKVKKGDVLIQNGIPVAKKWKLEHDGYDSNSWTRRIK